MHPKRYRFILPILLLFSFSGYGQTAANSPAIIPAPREMSMGKGNFVFSPIVQIVNREPGFEAQYLSESLQQQTGMALVIVPDYTPGHPCIQLSLAIPDTTVFDREAYQLSIGTDRILISAADAQGLFYGIQTLLQLLPASPAPVVQVPCLSISDKPTFSWRGMHLDVCRHFFPKSFIKTYIDYLALYKMNTFHWHLTDDQGWRIEIKKYPELTRAGAWRNGSMIGHYSEQRYDSLRYGGFYTQEDIREIVQYAADRHITVVPEIEMPGHALAALTAFPQYSCTGGPFEVARGWGVFDDVFCPKDETFAFLEDVLSEVMTLFPSTYIHIGGDECPKTRWKACNHCQALMKREKLKDEHELQSYFIQRIERFVNLKGRKIIGWDEILEGGLAPNAAVMSWQGTEGGIAAARLKHPVVMTPGSHCYFDHYQGDPRQEPIAIGGYTPLQKVYSYNPVPDVLSQSEKQYILGAQGNVWTEYINTTEHVEYMALPRMAALAEVVWGTSNPSIYKNFRDRVMTHMERLDKKNVHYSRSVFQVTSTVIPNTKGSGVKVVLKSDLDSGGIWYTVDGSEPGPDSKPYKGAFPISASTNVKAAWFKQGVRRSEVYSLGLNVSLSTGKKVRLASQPGKKYEGSGGFSLVNGVLGDSIRRSDWIGFRPDDLEAVVDLEKSGEISRVQVNFLWDEGSWIHYPKNVALYTSSDGTNFTKQSTVSASEITSQKGRVQFNFQPIKCRYVKIVAGNAGSIPAGLPGAGANAWLFVDEISVY